MAVSTAIVACAGKKPSVCYPIAPPTIVRMLRLGSKCGNRRITSLLSIRHERRSRCHVHLALLICSVEITQRFDEDGNSMAIPELAKCSDGATTYMIVRMFELGDVRS
jgi:hypothetical protein